MVLGSQDPDHQGDLGGLGFFCMCIFLNFQFYGNYRKNEGFPGDSEGKESAYNAGDLGSIPHLGRSPREVATHFSILAWRIPVDRGAWWATVHGVAKSQT